MEAYDDLASRFLETLVTVLVDFRPTYVPNMENIGIYGN